MATGANAARIVRIAAAQYPIERFVSLNAYRDKLTRWVGEAAANGAELLVFPEYGAMEYAGAAGDAASDLARSLDIVSEAIAEMDVHHAALAKKHGVHILAASGPVRREDRYVNAARLFSPSGRCGLQDKLIMTPFERRWGISPGSINRVFDTPLGRIGIAICYDSEFPLLVRAQVEAGAMLLLVPSCTEFVSGYHRVRSAAVSRALENGIATVQSPTVGAAPWSPSVDFNRGAAGIFVPAEQGLSDDGVVVSGTLDQPGWVYGAVDIGRLEAVRAAGEMRNFHDWKLQPGAGALPPVEVVDLG